MAATCQPRRAQRQVPALSRDCLPLKEPGHGVGELDQTTSAFPGRRAVPADVLPLTRRVPCANAKENPARSEHVKTGRVCRDMHRLADARLQHVGPQPQGFGNRRSASQGRPRRRPRTGMIAHQQATKAR